MQTAIFKFLALSGVIALGCFVVYQVHTRIPPVGEQTLSPGDFRSVAGDEGGTDPESGIPATDSGMPGPLPGQYEADSVAQPSLVGEAPPWNTLPLQSESESESQPASGSTTVPAAFWSEDSAAISTADDAREAPGSQSEVSASQTVHAADPAIGPEAPWLLNDLPEADSSNSPEPDEAFVTAGHDADEEPRTLTPLENVQPLPGAFMPDDDGDWARDEPSEAIADHDLLPVDGVQPSSQANPFAMTDVPSDPGHGEPEAAELPLLDFQNEPDPVPDDGAPTDPFSGFTEQTTPPAPVLPADPHDAGFAESRAIPIPPTVSSNPFAFAETEPEHRDDAEAPALPRVPDSGPEPESPASGADAPWNDSPEESPEIASPPLPTRGLGASDAEPAQTPRLPVLLDDSGDSAPPADLTPNPITVIADDEESEPEPAMQSDPFAPQSAGAGSPAENVLEPARNLELVGDATIDRASASTSQQPELDIEKIAPPEASVGSPLIYAIHIRNVGRSAAHGVVVEDRIPRGTVLDGTIPQAELTDKVLTWKLGTIEPGQEETIRIKVTPTEAGEIGSVATVRFAAEVSAATSITSADLRLDMDGPHEVALGETAVFHYTLTNAGDGPARGAYIRCLLPAAFEHPGGADIEYEVGDLQPGQSSDVELEIRAVEPGTHLSRVLLNANGRTYDESELSVNVLPSRLLISREGPARRFVGRSASYTTEITNRSGVDLTGISVIEQLPTALELAGIPEDGTYDPSNRTITWTIPSLAAGASVTVNSTVVAREYGLHSTSITARDRDGNEAHVMSDLQVAGFSTLEVDWEHDGKPLAVGEQVAMRLTIRNEGTAPARNVQAVFEVPPQMEFVNAQGPVPYQQEGQFVRFEGVSELAIDGEQSFDIVLTAAAPGNTRVSAQLLSDDQSEPLRHDEPLFILQDEN